jgi:pre-rRNA-processing protein RIX1
MPPPPSKRSSKGEDSVGALRTITSLLSTSDTAVLPTHIPTIVSLLYSSSVLESCHALANAQQKKKSSEDAGVLLHKYKTRISALLQSKTAQSRWCGAALVKASVESSWECLAGHGSVWIRLLVPLLAVSTGSPSCLWWWGTMIADAGFVVEAGANSDPQSDHCDACAGVYGVDGE